MKRLSLLDAMFLHIEDARSPMHIGSVCVFDGPAPTEDEVNRLFLGTLGKIPRYRQRVQYLPLELGRPVWIDDLSFDLHYHVRRTALASPGDNAALCTLMGRIMSHRLDRTRPLWEVWVIEGMEGGRWGLSLKVHHSMVDGVSGVDLLTALLDQERDAPPAPVLPWTPAPEPSMGAMVRDAWGGLADDAAGWFSKAQKTLAAPGETQRALSETTAGLMEFARRLRTTPKLSIEGSIGAHRAYAHADAPLALVRAIRKAYGGTLNDVVLAAIAGAYRTYLAQRGDNPDAAIVRTLVPVSVRADDAHGIQDNRVSCLLCELPVGEADPVARLKLVISRMAELKASHMAEVGEWVVDVGNLAPPMVVGTIARFVARTMHRLPQQSINTVTTNVPGPPVQLYCMGRTLRTILPYVPISQGLRTGTAILSYHDHLTFGVTGDYDSTGTDLTVLAQAMADGVKTLAQTIETAARARN